jgi:transcriptional regulator with XRE-family HTH domain
VDFGRWIKQLRLEQQLTGKALAALSGVDAGTISRVERGLTDTTLWTVVRLCTSLGVSFQEFGAAVRGQSTKLPHDQNSTKPIDMNSLIVEDLETPKDIYLLTIDDVVALVRFFRSSRIGCMQYTARFINQIIDIYHLKPILTETDKMKMLEFRHIDIPKISNNSPLKVIDIPYPSDIPLKTLQETELYGGVLIPEDFGVYIRKLRKARNMTLSELARLGNDGLSISALSRMENGSIEQITLTDALKIEERIDENLAVLGICWQVGLLKAEAKRAIPLSSDASVIPPGNWTDEEVMFANIFVKTFRWLQYLIGHNNDWILSMREAL